MRVSIRLARWLPPSGGRLSLSPLPRSPSVAALTAQTRLDNAKLLKPGTDSWPTFNGDYTGRRFSALTKITDKNVHQLSLAWMFRTDTGAGSTIKSTPLMVNGVLYFTVPDHVWAVDARTGRAALALSVANDRR